jgi:hypothetical protein
MSRILFLYETVANSIHAISMPYKGRSSKNHFRTLFSKRKLVNRNQFLRTLPLTTGVVPRTMPLTLAT